MTSTLQKPVGNQQPFFGQIIKVDFKVDEEDQDNGEFGACMYSTFAQQVYSLCGLQMGTQDCKKENKQNFGKFELPFVFYANGIPALVNTFYESRPYKGSIYVRMNESSTEVKINEKHLSGEVSLTSGDNGQTLISAIGQLHQAIMAANRSKYGAKTEGALELFKKTQENTMNGFGVSKHDLMVYEQWAAYHSFNSFYLTRSLGVHLSKQGQDKFIKEVKGRHDFNKESTGRRQKVFTMLTETWNFQKKIEQNYVKNFKATPHELKIYQQWADFKNGEKGVAKRIAFALGIYISEPDAQQFIKDLQAYKEKHKDQWGKRQKAFANCLVDTLPLFKRAENTISYDYYAQDDELKEWTVYYLTHGKDFKKLRQAHGLHLEPQDEKNFQNDLLKMAKSFEAFAGKIFDLNGLRTLRDQQFKLFVPSKISSEVRTDVGLFQHCFHAHLVTFNQDLASTINQAMHVDFKSNVAHISKKMYGQRMQFSQNIKVSHSMYPQLNSWNYFEPAQVTLFAIRAQSFGQEFPQVQQAIQLLQKYATSCRNKFNSQGVGIMVLKGESSNQSELIQFAQQVKAQNWSIYFAEEGPAQEVLEHQIFSNIQMKWWHQASVHSRVGLLDNLKTFDLRQHLKHDISNLTEAVSKNPSSLDACNFLNFGQAEGFELIEDSLDEAMVTYPNVEANFLRNIADKSERGVGSSQEYFEAVLFNLAFPTAHVFQASIQQNSLIESLEFKVQDKADPSKGYAGIKEQVENYDKLSSEDPPKAFEQSPVQNQPKRMKYDYLQKMAVFSSADETDGHWQCQTFPNIAHMKTLESKVASCSVSNNYMKAQALVYPQLVTAIQIISGTANDSKALMGLPFMATIVEKLQLTLLPLQTIAMKIASLNMMTCPEQGLKQVLESNEFALGEGGRSHLIELSSMAITDIKTAVGLQAMASLTEPEEFIAVADLIGTFAYFLSDESETLSNRKFYQLKKAVFYLPYVIVELPDDTRKPSQIPVAVEANPYAKEAPVAYEPSHQEVGNSLRLNQVVPGKEEEFVPKDFGQNQETPIENMQDTNNIEQNRPVSRMVQEDQNRPQSKQTNYGRMKVAQPPSKFNNSNGLSHESQMEDAEWDNNSQMSYNAFQQTQKVEEEKTVVVPVNIGELQVNKIARQPKPQPRASVMNKGQKPDLTKKAKAGFFCC